MVISKSKTLFFADPIEKIKGIGPKKAMVMRQQGLSQVGDLLRVYPAKYQDRSNIIPLASVTIGSEVMVLARLDFFQTFHARRGLTIISAEFSDNSGKIQARWFNKIYLGKQLIIGKKYWLFGSTSLLKEQSCLSNPEIEASISQSSQQNMLTSVYSSNSRLSAVGTSPLAFRKLIENVLEAINWQDSFPEEIRNSSFKAIIEAFKNIHKPDSIEIADKAKHTLAFFDQVLFQMGVLKRRENITGVLSLPDAFSASPCEPEFKLPFELTNGQKSALGQILFDLEVSKDKPPMNRLLQGDVGSGKTLVSFLAMLRFSQKLLPGNQCAFMAPTEILAYQHLYNFRNFFPEFADKATILTGSIKSAERKNIEKAIKTGLVQIIFGTHALFSEKVEFANLGFCVIDEQQRFGVNHRRQFVRKGKAPHLLLLSATPIPRTLSLTIFGDMDTSIIDDLPPGRQPIKTTIVNNFYSALPMIKQELYENHQIYMVCPLIEVSEKINWVSVEESINKITDLLPDIRVAALTSQQSWDEKQQIMQAFKNGQLDMIVATTVIEVGVDSPNATLMVIENADRFGLSQLHQLRGRVGRGSHASYCLLISASSEDSDRLKALSATNDGFELAMEDLRLRGPGDLTGTRQSGLSHPCFSHKISNTLIENARKRAFAILTGDNSEATRNWFCEQMQKSFGDSYKTFMEGG